MIRRIITHIRYPVLVVGLVLCLVGVAYAATSNIDPTKKWAWNKNVGWVNFDPDGDEGVTVYADHLEGYAWAENAGWIRFKKYQTAETSVGGYTEPLRALLWPWLALVAAVVAGAIAAAALKRREA
jgi:hypothetical protein